MDTGWFLAIDHVCRFLDVEEFPVYDSTLHCTV